MAKRSRIALALALALVLGGGPAMAWEMRGNPDRWPSLLLQQTGSDTLNGRQLVANPGKPTDDRSQRTLNVVSAATINLPVLERLSVNAGASLNLIETDTEQTPQYGATTTDNSIMGFSLGLRYFLVEHELTKAGASDNPDRWPSIGIGAQGTTTFNYDAGNTAANLLPQAFDSRTLVFSSEERLPLSDRHTVTATVVSTLIRSETAPTAALNGSLTHQTFLSGTLQWRYYWVGRNLIAKDSGTNPDRWTMFFLTAGGNDLISSDQTVTPPVGAVQTRRLGGHGVSGGLGARLPMTDHSTVTLEFDEGYSRSATPAVPASAGTTQKLTSLTFQAMFKYYFY